MAQQNNKEVKKQREKASKKAAYFGAALALVLIGLVGIIIWAVNYSPNLTVYSVGEQEVKKDLYTCVYYYDSMASKDWSQYGFDKTKDPYEQKFTYYAGEDRFDTWGEYFEKLTNDSLRFMLVMNDVAQKGGFHYSKDVQTHVDTEIAGIEKEKNNAMSFEEYMLRNFGALIKKDVFEQYLQLYYKATEFYKQITESKALFNKYIGGNASDFEKTYLAHRDDIDVVSFRYIYVENTKENAALIADLKAAESEKAFQKLCNAYKNEQSYTEDDSSLFKNMPLKSIHMQTKSELAKKLSSDSSKAGDIYFAETTGENGEKVVDILYVVKARAKDSSAYNDTDVKQWEFSAMSIMLEDYYDTNYRAELSEKGIAAFKKSMIIPEG